MERPLANEAASSRKPATDTLLTRKGSRGTEFVDQVLGERLRQRRVLLGYSQKTLSDWAGITYQQLQKYEQGKNRVSASRLFALARALNVSIGYFFADLDTAEQRCDREPIVRDREQLEANRLFASIQDAPVKRGVLKMLREIAGDSDQSP